ncbi:colanic acid biosynthesis glycosyltransferase WcaL [Pontixanthobacter gangjinensis]|uniref:Colanic acid biosynthesis glycosyltransferase WcaL n=1 Tax=Christiangramia aestuarii TaxID=1028746 RepID=A0A7K1LN89_9FLAO|nr:glycosyltransferase [Christiangramia aestuarii]MUP42198.1 colanic acid biosynthesis glycosyltransferase WcaL [Christiangramia aestuarii]
MDIAFIFTEFPSGQVSNSTRVFSFLEMGYNVTVYANTCGNKHLSYEVRNKYPNLDIIYFQKHKGYLLIKEFLKDFFIAPRISLKRWQKAFNKELFFIFYLKKILGGRGLKNDSVTLQKRRNAPISYLRLKQLENKNHDFFICFFGPTGLNFLFLKELYPKALFCTYFVGFDYSSRLSQYGSTAIYKQLFSMSDIIFAKSTFSQQTLVEIGCNEEKIILDYNGINLNKFEHCTPKVQTNETVKFIIVSRLIAKKSHILILKAFIRIISINKNFKFTIVGEGPLREKIEEFIKKNPELFKRVELIGNISQEEVVSLLRLHHVFIHPSTTSIPFGDKEDTPTAILEAMAIGLPIISTFHAGIPDLVKNNENGILVPERNIDYLVDAINYFLNYPEKINQFGNNSRKIAEEKFDTGQNCLRLVKILKENQKKIAQ